MDSNRILIDGIRQKETLNTLKEMLNGTNIGIIYVHTSPDLSYKFYSERENTNCSIFDYLTVRNAPVENEVEEAIGMADAVLYNWAGISEYKQTIRLLMDSIEK